jgi:uncharacterized phage protein (TIGR01671 family)
MRELKFRAWDLRAKEWLSVEEMILEDGLCYDNWRDYEDGEPNRYLEIGQYTGLVDSTGRDIYEGDILCEDNLLDGTVTVIFEDGSFVLRFGDTIDLLAEWNQSMYITGNIYENPEMLVMTDDETERNFEEEK